MTPDPEPATKVVLLGTGTPIADPERSGPSLAVVIGDVAFLVDLGPGVVRRAAAACQAGVHALAVEKLKHAFVTHLHSDHTVGYPDFIFTPWVLGRDEPVEVYGPAGIHAMTQHLLAAYERDVHERLSGLEPANRRGYLVHAHEVEPDSSIRMRAWPWRPFAFTMEAGWHWGISSQRLTGPLSFRETRHLWTRWLRSQGVATC